MCCFYIGILLSLCPLRHCILWVLHPKMDLSLDLNLRWIFNFLTTISFTIKLVCVLTVWLCFYANPFVPNAFFLYRLKTSERVHWEQFGWGAILLWGICPRTTQNVEYSAFITNKLFYVPDQKDFLGQFNLIYILFF